MKTAEELLHEYFRNCFGDDIPHVVTAMKLYAKQACAEQRKICADYAEKKYIPYVDEPQIDSESILNAPEPELL